MLDRSDIVFLDMFYVLDNKMKCHTSEGLGVVKSATPVSITIEDKLWAEGKLGEENGKQLVETLLFLLGINAGLRGSLEHKCLRHLGFNPQFNVILDGDGFKGLQFREDAKTKNHQGGATVRPRIPKVVNIYPNFDNIDRCPVRLYKKVHQFVPNNQM